MKAPKQNPCLPILIVLFFLLLFVISGSTQTDSVCVLKGKVVDADLNNPLIYVNIMNHTSGGGTISDANGNFEATLSYLPSQLEFSYVGYDPKIIDVDTVHNDILTVSLSKTSQVLPEVIVSSKIRVEAVTKSEYSVKDFIPYDGKILILKSKSSFGSHILALTDVDGKLIDQMILDKFDKIESLHQSCLGGLYIVTSTSVYEVSINADNKMVLSEELMREKFDKLIRPCVLSSKSHLYYRHNYYQGQMVEFIGYQKGGEHSFLLTKIADEKNIELFFTDVLPKIQGMPGGAAIEKSRDLQNLRTLEQDVDNTLHLFYQPLYLPIVNTGKELCIFKHFEAFAEFYNYAGILLKKIPLPYVKNEKWGKLVLADKVTGKSYIVFNKKKGKTLREFKYESGSLGEEIVFNAFFVEKMMVHDGNLFFLESGLVQTSRSSVNRVLKKISFAKVK
ncbi:MAG: hypothetical protein GY705_31235 [Bacteroidetes bacterium]|nr:hypothetical protein [Bacteroidota bacterium]